MKFSTVIAIILSSIIISTSLLFIQFAKNDSAEKMMRDKKNKEMEQNIKLEFCTGEAENNYWSYIKLNGKENLDGTITADNNVWDRAEKNKQNSIDNCFKMYK